MMNFLASKKESWEFWDLDKNAKFQVYLAYLSDIG